MKVQYVPQFSVPASIQQEEKKTKRVCVYILLVLSKYISAVKVNALIQIPFNGTNCINAIIWPVAQVWRKHLYDRFFTCILTAISTRT